MGRVSPYLSGTQDSSTFLLYHLWNCLSFSRSPHEPHGAQWLPGTNFQTIYISYAGGRREGGIMFLKWAIRCVRSFLLVLTNNFSDLLGFLRCKENWEMICGQAYCCSEKQLGILVVKKERVEFDS